MSEVVTQFCSFYHHQGQPWTIRLSKSDILKHLKNDFTQERKRMEASMSLRSIEKNFILKGLDKHQMIFMNQNQIFGIDMILLQDWLASSETSMPILLICEAGEIWRDIGINYFSFKRGTSHIIPSRLGFKNTSWHVFLLRKKLRLLENAIFKKCYIWYRYW